MSVQYADTKTVTMADSPIEDPSILNPATFPAGGPRSEQVCPICCIEQSSIGRHFANKCEYPILTQDEASALLGAWMAGAYVNPPEGRGTPRLIIRAKNNERLKAVQPNLGICGRDMFDMTQQDRRQLNTTPHPALEELRNADRSNVTLTRRAAEIVFLLRGEYVDDETIQFRNLIAAEEFADSLRTVGIDAELVDNRTVQLTGSDESTFASWAGTTALSK